MEVEVVRENCVGSGWCVRIAPEVFQLDPDDKAVVVDPQGAAPESIVEAADNCPTGAIVLHGEDGVL